MFEGAPFCLCFEIFLLIFSNSKAWLSVIDILLVVCWVSFHKILGLDSLVKTILSFLFDVMHHI